MRVLLHRAAVVAGAAAELLDPAVGVATVSAAAPEHTWSQSGITITSHGGTWNGWPTSWRLS